MAFILRHEYLICYDIHDTKKRTRVAQELERNGMRRVQHSVFWGFLTKAELNAIQRFSKHTLDADDKAFITRTNFNTKGNSLLVGHLKKDFRDWDENYVL